MKPDWSGGDLHGSAQQCVRGLYAVTPQTHDTAELQRRVRAAIAGGARMVQYRDKTSHQALRAEQAEALRRLCRATAVPLIVNDDIEMACAIRADGVHLGKEDAPLSAARAALGPGALIGVSCYDDLARAIDAERAGVSYVAFGSFYPSSVKPGAVRAPIELLRKARAALQVPIVAIGGITVDNAGALITAGADAVAVISALFDADDPSASARTFGRLFATLSPNPNFST